MTHRNRPRRSRERLRLTARSRLSPAPIRVELSWDAPADVLAAAEEAIRAVASLATVELVRVPQERTFCVRGSLIAWNAPASAARRQVEAMDTFAEAFEAARAAAAGSGDKA